MSSVLESITKYAEQSSNGQRLATAAEEGIDKKLAVLDYGRAKFIYGMLPALRNAVSQGQRAVVHCCRN